MLDPGQFGGILLFQPRVRAAILWNLVSQMCLETQLEAGVVNECNLYSSHKAVKHADDVTEPGSEAHAR